MAVYKVTVSLEIECEDMDEARAMASDIIHDITKEVDVDSVELVDIEEE